MFEGNPDLLSERITDSLKNAQVDKPAVVTEDRAESRIVTYGELRGLISHYRQQLRALGMGPGQLLPILGRQTPEVVALTFAVLLEGSAFCFLSDKFSPADWQWLVDEMDPIGLVVDGYGAQLLTESGLLARAAGATAGAPRPVLLDVADDIGAATRATLGPREQLPVLSISGDSQPELARPGRSSWPAAAHAHFSSGSTGRPKAVLGSRNGLLHFADVQIQGCGLSPADRLLCTVGFSGNLGLVQMFSALFTGASLHLARSRTNQDLGQIIRRSQITGIGASTAAWTAAMADSPVSETLFGEVASLRYISTGGVHMPRSRIRQLSRRLGCQVRIYEIYGQAEVRQMTHFPINAPENRDKIASVGRSVPGSMLFVAADEDTVAPVGTVGEIVHCGPGIMLGYLGEPELTASQLRTHGSVPGRTVIYTGDLGYQDADGYVYLKGRESRRIRLAERSVWPSEIEDVIADQPGVAEAIVVGVELSGISRIAAAVVADGHLNADQLRDSVARELPPELIPSYLTIWPRLPLTPNGKPSVRAIQAKLVQEFSPMADRAQ